MLFTARSIDAETADQWGLVNRVVPHETLMDEAMATAAQIAAQPPQALRMAKSLLRQGRDMNFDQMLELSAAMQALAQSQQAMLAAQALGGGTAEMVGYTDSGYISGDTRQVVGYAGVIFN